MPMGSFPHLSQELGKRYLELAVHRSSITERKRLLLTISSSEFFPVNIHPCWVSHSAREAEHRVGAYVEIWAHGSKDACVVDVKFPRCVSPSTHISFVG